MPLHDVSEIKQWSLPEMERMKEALDLLLLIILLN